MEVPAPPGILECRNGIVKYYSNEANDIDRGGGFPLVLALEISPPYLKAAGEW
jgi:hypothetical protein